MGTIDGAAIYDKERAVGVFVVVLYIILVTSSK